MPNSKIAIVWRGDREARSTATPENTRLKAIFAALSAEGFAPEPAVFAEEFADEVREQLLAAKGVLVFVDPLSNGRARDVLDPLLREVAARGVWVSAHPDTILKMGTKEVLFRTKSLGWGVDTRLYRDAAEFARQFPDVLASSGPRVLKQNRGNGGQDVWKIELLDRAPNPNASVRILHAQRGSLEETTTLGAFMKRCEEFFARPNGAIVDQPFQPRLPEGMIRCYSSGDKVAGYGQQLIKGLIPPPPEGPDSPEAQPGPRIMYGPDEPKFQALRNLMERDWIPGLMKLTGIAAAALPAIWDADFLLGPRSANGEDSYVLCEINVSSVFPIPDEAPAAIARYVKQKIGG
jgi:hypothetical protein